MSDVVYTRINWKDSPSTDTPINSENLNRMDKGIFDCATQINALNIATPKLSDNNSITGSNTFTNSNLFKGVVTSQRGRNEQSVLFQEVINGVTNHSVSIGFDNNDNFYMWDNTTSKPGLYMNKNGTVTVGGVNVKEMNYTKLYGIGMPANNTTATVADLSQFKLIMINAHTNTSNTSEITGSITVPAKLFLASYNYTVQNQQANGQYVVVKANSNTQVRFLSSGNCNCSIYGIY